MARSWYSSRCPVGVTAKRSAYLREDVARERQAGWLGQGRGPEPVRDAADLHSVGHAVVAGTGLQALLQFVGVPPILVDTDRGPRLLGDLAWLTK